ncbi:hypothetical protein [Vibrio cyclitrophicus]|uniref:Uncharacterized protein n=1 Tax=Vibrio cyclitrophicus TaxID=47951 RepID=A0ACD5G2H7_9VIBR
MSELITSNAYNFSEYITSGVDARTGTFSITLSLGEFISHKTSGPVLDMKLTYSEQSSFDNGFGRGWSLPISRFSSTNNMLRLSNGQAFKIQWNAAQNEYDLEYRRLKDIRVVRDSSSDNMIVLYKNGRTETLDLEEGLLRESTNESGLAIKLDYRLFNGEYVVSKIYDDSGTELEIDAWTDQWVATITHRLNGSAEKIFNINKTANGQFKRLSRFDINGDDQVRIDYLWISTGFDVIVGVEHPSGLIDEVTYNPNGHYMPTNAPFQTVPNVTTHRVETGDNQPAKVSRYTYSDANYLGYASDAAWIAGEDTLFRARNNYKYTVTETINTKVVVERTYNKYHFLELEEHSFDGVVFKKDTNEYFANLDVGIGSQPPKYSLLKSTVATFYAGGSSRPVVTNYDYDDYGNQTYLEENSGDRVIHDYYPVGGDSGNAPPAPNGIVSLLKQTQFLPINTGNGEVVRTTSYKYKSLINLDDPALHFAVVIEQKAENQTIQYSYHESSSAPLEYGRVKSETSTINSYSELVEFAYTFNANTFLSSQTVTTHDGIQSKSDELLRLYDAQPLERTEYLDLSDSSDYITNTFDYDERGRITAETAAKNTAYEAKVITSYVIGDGVNSATSTDSKGNIKTEKYNNAGQLIQTLASDSNGTLRVTKDIYYNEFGLPSTEKSQDWNGGVLLYTQEIQYEYDHFGQVNEITHSDGRKEYIDQDPVTLISKHTMQGLIVESTTFNERGLEIEKKTEGSSGQIITLSTMAYDGYGNLIMSEDTDGNITKMSYDKLDRVSEIERTVDGQKVIESYEYADFVNEELPTKLSIGSGVFQGSCHHLLAY